MLFSSGSTELSTGPVDNFGAVDRSDVAGRRVWGEAGTNEGMTDPTPPTTPSRRSTPLEEYALLSDMRTGPLVSRTGSIDWLCLPRYDSPAAFAAILGGAENGRWRLSVVGGAVVDRRYRGDTFIVETVWRCPHGTAQVTDFLPTSNNRADIIRRVECLEGYVEVEHDLRVRFSYSRVLPWFRPVTMPGSDETGLICTAGPEGLLIAGPLLQATTSPTIDDDDLPGADLPDASGGIAPRLTGTFRIEEGEHRDWEMIWFRPWRTWPKPNDVDQVMAETEEHWINWLAQLDLQHDPVYRGYVARSLLVLRGLTHIETGGIVAAPTTSLPEDFGGVRNWDYRYTWLRDAAMTVEVLVAHGLLKGANAWRDWLIRAVAGDPMNLQIMYGIGGERELPEQELDHLRGYENSRPVRIGNGAAAQYQADVVGEVMLALAAMRDAGYPDTPYSWGLQTALLEYTVENYDRKDHGIWEMRGDLHYFTHGRVMMWAAFSEGIRAIEEHGYEGDVTLWREYRERLHEEIHERGWNEELQTFTQTYEGYEVDASLLALPHTKFLSPEDPRMLATVARIEKDLLTDGALVYRYRTERGIDGLEGDEYPFLICAFWLVEQYAASGRLDDAREHMDQLLGYTTDLGLMAEEYDPALGRLAGNFPQAFSHLALIRAADAIDRAAKTENAGKR